jgi:hypothetical protein
MIYNPRRHKQPAPVEPKYRLPCGHGEVEIMVTDGARVYSVICPVCSTDYNVFHKTVVRPDGQLGHAFRPLTGPRT